MLPQIAPAGMDGLSLCGSKAAFVQGGSERVPLPSSKPHVVRAPDLPTISASGSAWGVKVKRVKQELQQGREARVPASRSSEATLQGRGASATARDGAVSSGSKSAVLGTDQGLEGLAATRGGEGLEGWGEDDSDVLLNAVRHHADGATWLSVAPASSSAAARRWPMVDSVDDKENNPGRLTARGQDDGKPNIQLAPAHPENEQPTSDPHRPGLLEAARRDTGKRSRGEGTGGRSGGAARKDELIQRGSLPRLTARSRAPSCPEPQDRDASRRIASVPSSDISHSAKQTAPTPAAATRRGGGTGPGPTLTGIMGKGRLASTLPTPSSQQLPGSDDKTHMHALLSGSHVGQAAASVARRARSADDPPYSGAHGGGGTGGEVRAGAGREDTVQRDMVKEVREKAPVDLAALMQKAKERIAAKKQKERQQMQEWEAHQERVKRERQEAKEGADAEVAQRRAAIYAFNYLMHQQEWGAWLEFERARERGRAEGRERGREREGEKGAWLEFEREQKDLKECKSRPSSSSSSASKRRTPALALPATTNPAAAACWSDGDVPAADDADDDEEEECLWKDEME